MKKHNLPRRILTGALTALFSAVVALFGYTTLARLSGNPLPTVFGWGSAVVLSGSMEPELPVGALLVIHREKNYRVGEIVTYEDDSGSLVTHRLVAFENGEAIARGDANNTSDAPFPASQIRGKVRAMLPGVGSTILWLKTPPGLCTILLAIALLILLPRIFHTKGGKPHDGTQ